MGPEFPHIRAALERGHLTFKWPEQVLAELCSNSESKLFRDGERVVKAGEVSDRFWIVTEGRFLLTRTWPNGRRFLYSYLKPGDVTGVVSVFDGLPAAYDLVARGDASAIVVPGTALRSVFRNHPEVALDIVRFLCTLVRGDIASLELYAMNSVRCRIAKSILWIARDQPLAANREIVIDTKISQEDLADIVCAARQSVNRELRHLMKEGIIKQRYRAIIILDRDRLVRVAAEDEESPPPAAARASGPNRFISASD